MKVLLNASSGNRPVDGIALKRAEELYFDGIRRDILHSASKEQLRAIAKQAFRLSHLQWILLFGYSNPETIKEQVKILHSWLLPDTEVWFEVGFEVGDDWINSPEGYAAFVNAQARSIRQVYPEARIITGAVMDISRRHQEFLQRAIPVFNPSLEISVHTYRETQAEPSEGFETVEEMFSNLKGILHGSKWHNTETGWHTATRGNLCKVSKWLAERLGRKCRNTYEEVGEWVVEEIKKHELEGAESFTVYQAFNGPKDESESKFGILKERTLEPLPSAKIIANYLRGRKA